jgi:hypothetical protein
MLAGALDTGFNTCSNKSAIERQATGLHDMRNLPHKQAYAATGDVTWNKAGVDSNNAI